MAVTRPPLRERRLARPPAMDRSTLLIASVASVLAALVTSALGQGFAATLLAAAIVPTLTAFVTHPGPHGRRRIAAALVLLAFLRGARKAVARPARRSSAPARKTTAMLHGGAAFGLAATALTLLELLLGHAAFADRSATLLPPASHQAILTPHRAGNPVISVPPHGVVRTATARWGARVTFAATARDGRGAPLTPGCAPASGARFGVGQTVVRCTAVDLRGRRGAAEFPVTVRPAVPGHVPAPPGLQHAPSIRTPAAIVREAPAGHSARVTYVAGATDAAGHALTPACSPPSGSAFAPGTTRVTCTAVDAAGASATAGFTVTIRAAGRPRRPDHQAPRLVVPAGLDATATDADGAAVTYRVRADDDRDGAVTAVCVPPSGSRFAVGRTTVRCSATDRAGNLADATFPVTVAPPKHPADDRPPRLVLPGTVQRDAADATGAVVTYEVRAVDAHDGPVPASCTPASGSRFVVGTTTVACSASDRAGNVGHATFTVEVRAPAPHGDPRGEPDPGPRPEPDHGGPQPEHATPEPDRRPHPVARPEPVPDTSSTRGPR
jgi:hypothetical protein